MYRDPSGHCTASFTFELAGPAVAALFEASRMDTGFAAGVEAVVGALWHPVAPTVRASPSQSRESILFMEMETANCGGLSQNVASGKTVSKL